MMVDEVGGGPGTGTNRGREKKCIKKKEGGECAMGESLEISAI